MKGRHRMCYSGVSWPQSFLPVKWITSILGLETNWGEKTAPGTERPWISLLWEVHEEPGLPHQNNYRSCHKMEANIWPFFVCLGFFVCLFVCFPHWHWGWETLRSVLITTVLFFLKQTLCQSYILPVRGITMDNTLAIIYSGQKVAGRKQRMVKTVKKQTTLTKIPLF